MFVIVSDRAVVPGWVDIKDCPNSKPLMANLLVFRNLVLCPNKPTQYAQHAVVLQQSPSMLVSVCSIYDGLIYLLFKGF